MVLTLQFRKEVAERHVDQPVTPLRVHDEQLQDPCPTLSHPCVSKEVFGLWDREWFTPYSSVVSHAKGPTP